MNHHASEFVIYSSRHAFVSYVRENKDVVERLCSDLHSAGITTWLDRDEIQPGQRWKDAIRQAIKKGLYFLCCFSSEGLSKEKSYMNEEVTIAIEELRLRPSNRTWFIPIKLDNCPIPERYIGGGESLADIHCLDLSENWEAGIQALVSTLLPDRTRNEELYKAAFESIKLNFSSLKCRRKINKFTIGIIGNSGVGKSTLATALSGFEYPLRDDEVFYDNQTRYYDWPKVGLLADIPPLGYGLVNPDEMNTLLTETIDFVLYVISASSHIHREDVEAIKIVMQTNIPCIVILNQFDLIRVSEKNNFISIIKEHTGVPVLPVSALTLTNVDLLRAHINELSQQFSRSTAAKGRSASLRAPEA